MSRLLHGVRWALRGYGDLAVGVRVLPPVLLAAALWWLSSRPGVDAEAPVIESLYHNSKHVLSSKNSAFLLMRL